LLFKQIYDIIIAGKYFKFFGGFNKMKKRALSILLITALLLSLLTACGGGNDNDTSSGGTPTNGNDNPASKKNNDHSDNNSDGENKTDTAAKETTEQPIIEDNKLYLIVPTHALKIYDDFISNPELGIKVNLISLFPEFTESFVDGISIDYEKIDGKYSFDGLVIVSRSVEGCC